MIKTKLFLGVLALAVALAGNSFFTKIVSAGAVTAADIQSASTIRLGSSGQSALIWQRFLNIYNNAGLTEDGTFGSLSVAQAKIWQTSRNLIADGLLGSNSRAAAIIQMSGGSSRVEGGGTMISVNYKPLKLLPDIIIGGITFPNAGSANILQVTNSGNNPVLITDATFNDSYQNPSGGHCDASDKTCTATSSAKGNISGPRYFSLANPLNPIVDMSKAWSINTTDDAFGDFGPALNTDQGIAWSADGQYSALKNSQRNLFFYHSGTYKFISKGGSIFNDFAGIVQSGGNNLYIGHSKILNMTDFESQGPKPLPPNAPQQIISVDGSIADRSIILGDMFAHLSFGALGGKIGGSGSPNLKLYSPTQSSPVIDYNLPASITSVSDGATTGFVAPDGSKYVIIGALSKIFIYQADSSGAKFLPIAENISLPGVSITGSAIATSVIGVIINGERAIMTFNTSSAVIPKIFLFSDLTKGVVKNVAQTTTPSLGRVNSATAYYQGNNTYVYTSSVASGGAHDISVWSFTNAPADGGGCDSKGGGGGSQSRISPGDSGGGHYEEVCTQWADNWSITPQYSYNVFNGVHGTACTGPKVFVTSGTEGGNATQAACEADLANMNPGQCHALPSQDAWDQYYKATGNQVDGYMYTFGSPPRCVSQQYCAAKKTVWKGLGGPTTASSSGSSNNCGVCRDSSATNVGSPLPCSYNTGGGSGSINCAVSVGGSIVYYTSTTGSCN